MTIILPTTITSVSVSCSPTTVPGGQTSQCTATVQGTAGFDPTVTWGASLGTIASTGKDAATYTAPSSATGVAAVTATSSEDATKSGTATLNVTRNPPSGSWEPTGPPGGSITVLAEDPSNPNTVYAGTSFAGNGGLWKSTDAGNTWASMVTNSALDYSSLSDLAVENGGQVLYAAERGYDFFTSMDGGATWTTAQIVPSGSPAGIGGMAVDPQNSATIYLSAPGLGVSKSVNGGSSWTLLASSPVITTNSAAAVLHNAIQVDPTNTSRVYYGTDHGLYVTTDGGTTWSVSSSGIASGDSAVRDVAVDPAAPSSIFVLAGIPTSAVVDLYESTNAGNSWTPLAVGVDAERVVPDPVKANTIYLYGLQIHAAYKSTDGGRTFSPSDTGTPSAGSSGSGSNSIALTGPTGTMIPLASDPGNFLLTIGGSGIYRTQDAAQSWTFSTQGLSAWWGAAVAFDPEVPTTIYFGALNGGGIFKSTDSGLTWINLRQDSPTGIAVDPFDSTHILVAALDEGLIESRDGGTNWAIVSSKLPPPPNGKLTYITGINFHPTQQGTIFISTEHGGVGLVRSTDGGGTYATDNAGLTSTDVTGCFASNPQDPLQLMIIDGAGLTTSIDGGNTWVEGTTQLFCPFSIDTKSKPPTVYAEEQTAPGTPLVGVKSTDFGKTWTVVGAGAPWPWIADSSTSGSLFSVNSWSSDGGATWTPLLSSGLGQSLLSTGGYFGSGGGFVLAPSEPQVLFVASRDDGILRFDVGP